MLPAVWPGTAMTVKPPIASPSFRILSAVRCGTLITTPAALKSSPNAPLRGLLAPAATDIVIRGREGDSGRL